MWDCRWPSSSASTTPTIGYDLSPAKISAYQAQRDPTGEVAPEEFRASRHFEFTTDATQLRAADAVIVAVPTPIDAARLPDFAPLLSASRTVGDNLKRGAIVVYESTVYPGATEEVCVPVLEAALGPALEAGFLRRLFARAHQSRRQAAHAHAHHQSRVGRHAADAGGGRSALRDRWSQAGVYRASSIRVAEAAKVIENTQRDLNIALMNELAIIFNRHGTSIRSRCWRRRARSGISCRSGRAWSAGTASASIRTI